MGFMSDVSRLMKVATKPDRKEMWLVIRVTALGMSGLGLLGFLIKLASEVIFVAKSNTGSSTSSAAAFVMQLFHIAMLLPK